MLEKLKDAEGRYISMEEQLADSEIFSDQERFTALTDYYNRYMRYPQNYLFPTW